MKTTVGIICLIVLNSSVFADGDLQSRLEELRSLANQRKEAIDFLLRILEVRGDRQDPLERHGAIVLLGDYRAVKACPALVREITLHTGRGRGSEPRPLRNHPAAEALVRIGAPAAKELLASTEKKLSQNHIRLYAFTLDEIYGKDARPLLIHRLRHELESLLMPPDSTAETKIANLTSLLRFIESKKVDDPRESPAFHHD